MKNPNKLYEFHVANLKEIERAINKIALILRLAISQDDKITISAFTRLYALLLGTWAECRLRKLLFEPKGFSNEDRSLIMSNKNQLDQWKKTLEIAFRRQYCVPKAPLSKDVLSHSANSRYETLKEMLSNDLGFIIELRNKLAHGQWIYPLNDNGNDIAQSQMNALRIENLLSLQFKKKLLESLSAVIHDLIVSKPTFERDFDVHLRVVVENQRNLRNRDYEDWVRKMKQKYIQGKAIKISSSKH